MTRQEIEDLIMSETYHTDTQDTERLHIVAGNFTHNWVKPVNEVVKPHNIGREYLITTCVLFLNNGIHAHGTSSQTTHKSTRRETADAGRKQARWSAVKHAMARVSALRALLAEDAARNQAANAPPPLPPAPGAV